MSHSELFADCEGTALFVGSLIFTPSGETGRIVALLPWQRDTRGLAIVRLSGGRKVRYICNDLWIDSTGPEPRRDDDLIHEIDREIRWLNSHSTI